MLGGLSLKIRQVPTMQATEIILASVSSPGSKRGNGVLETLILRGVHNVEGVYMSPRRAMEVRCSIPERILLCVVMLTVESADTAL